MPAWAMSPSVATGGGGGPAAFPPRGKAFGRLAPFTVRFGHKQPTPELVQYNPSGMGGSLHTSSSWSVSPRPLLIFLFPLYPT